MKDALIMVEINDHLAGYLYVLDTANRVAHRLVLQQPPLSIPPLKNGAIRAVLILYWLWVSFASALNLAIGRLNR